MRTENPYLGAKAVLATMHGKEVAIAPALERRPGLTVEGTDGLDTDTLGTFTGEVSRTAGPIETAIRKAGLGIESSGIPIGLATEGSFGPDPRLPMLANAFEVIVFLDTERGIELVEVSRSPRTNFSSLLLTGDDRVSREFLDRIGFPDHALIVRPGGPESDAGGPIEKGIRDSDRLDHAIARSIDLSGDGTVRVETDMRAHMNPTRMAGIAALAEMLGRRLECRCPECQAPGFGRTGSTGGLPCSVCGTPTGWILHETLGCAVCRYSIERPREDGLLAADPRNCPNCNP